VTLLAGTSLDNGGCDREARFPLGSRAFLGGGTVIEQGEMVEQRILPEEVRVGKGGDRQELYCWS
jgi:hypothetical protein